MIAAQTSPNSFEFVVIAGARARQLLRRLHAARDGRRAQEAERLAQKEVKRRQGREDRTSRTSEWNRHGLIALGVTGGIGAYKAVEVARGLQKRGHDVVAIMTRSATRFVGPVTFEAITRRPVITDQFDAAAPTPTSSTSRSPSTSTCC